MARLLSIKDTISSTLDGESKNRNEKNIEWMQEIKATDGSLKIFPVLRLQINHILLQYHTYIHSHTLPYIAMHSHTYIHACIHTFASL